MDFPNGHSIVAPQHGHKHTTSNLSYSHNHDSHSHHDHDHNVGCAGGHQHTHQHALVNHNSSNNSDGCKHGCCDNKNTNPGGMPPGARANPTSADLFKAIEMGDLPMVHYIVTRLSGSIHVVDSLGNTSLHVCARRGYVAIARYLIEQGADINAVNSSGHTPLMYATTHGQISMCNALLQLGADAYKQDNLGFNVIMHAAQYGNMFVMHHLLTNTKVDIDEVDRDGHTALCWAVYNGHEDLVQYMLGPLCPCVPHLGFLDKTNRTPLHWAASKDFPKVCSMLIEAKCQKCESDENEGKIVANPCPSGKEMLTMRDADGRTPVECASYKGNNDTARALEYEQNGIRALAVTEASNENTTKELAMQYASTAVPFHLMFWALPYVPFYVPLIGIVVTIWAHSSGLLQWSNTQKTMVPNGLLSSCLIGMLYCMVLQESSVFTFAFFLGSELLLYYSYYHLMFEDPGIIPPSESYIQKALDVSAKGLEPSNDYCRKCKVIKTSRSKHCHYCKICTDRHDHHCYWIYNCVAKKNYWRFYVFLIQCLSQMLLYVIVSLFYVWPKISSTDSMITEGIPLVFQENPQVTWMIVFFSAFFMPLLTLFVYHTGFVGRDITTYELITGNRRKKSGGHSNAANKQFSIIRLINFLQYGPSIFEGSNNNRSPMMNV